jgi:hypothetical protein
LAAQICALFAQGTNRPRWRPSVPSLFMPTPPKRQYNTNFTHFEAVAIFRTQVVLAVLKRAQEAMREL